MAHLRGGFREVGLCDSKCSECNDFGGHASMARTNGGWLPLRIRIIRTVVVLSIPLAGTRFSENRTLRGLFVVSTFRFNVGRWENYDDLH